MNADKTDFITFQTKNNKYKNTHLIVKDEVILSSSTVKCLGVYLDQNLTFQEEGKHTLRKMACGIKTFYSIRDYFPENNRLLLLNALVIKSSPLPGNFVEWLDGKSQYDLREAAELGNKSVF